MEAEAMRDTAQQDAATAERVGEQATVAGTGALVEAEQRARSQAALVRESLVRCPGVSDPAPE